MPRPGTASWSGVGNAENARSVAASVGAGKTPFGEHLLNMHGEGLFVITK